MKSVMLSLILLSATVANAQNELPSRIVYKVTIDYAAGTVTIPNNGKKYDNLKVGSVLQISLLHMPEGYIVKGKTVFENDKMEGAVAFSGFIGQGLESGTKNEDNKDATMPSNKQIAKEKLHDIINEQTEKVKEANSKVIHDIEKEISHIREKSVSVYTTTDRNAIADLEARKKALSNTKINIENFTKALKISNTSNFLKGLLQESKMGKFNALTKYPQVNLKQAIEDYQDQLRIIKIAQENFKNLDDLKTKLIDLYAGKADSLQTLVQFEKDTLVAHNLIGVQVLNRDYTNVEIEIFDKDNNRKNLIPLSFNNKKGFKLDFSTGFFNSFQRIKDYEILNNIDTIGGILTANDSTFNVKELDRGRNNLSIGILAHAYSRDGAYFNVGAAFGFSYSLQEKSLSLLAGASVLLGKEQRFIFNGGIAFTKAKELTVFTANTKYHKSLLNQGTTLKYSENTRGSLYLGITYNLGSIKTQSETRILN